MLQQLLVLIGSAVVTVLAVRLLVVRGIGELGAALNWNAKLRGQLIGYATSLPEFVVLVSSAWAGVFTAGFWNIASSNIINAVLLCLAILAYRQHHELFDRRFRDELAFGFLSVVLPLVLNGADADLTWKMALFLMACFAAYKIADIRLNKALEEVEACASGGTPIFRSVCYLLAGIAVVLIAGRYLGGSAGQLVQQLSVPAWAVGWLLGFITSVPEMTSFFEIYRLAKSDGLLEELQDTQSALDAMVASNWCNLGVILPSGILIYLLVN